MYKKKAIWLVCTTQLNCTWSFEHILTLAIICVPVNCGPNLSEKFQHCEIYAGKENKNALDSLAAGSSSGGGEVAPPDTCSLCLSDGVRSLDCFGRHNQHKYTCMWEPGERAPGRAYTLVVQQWVARETSRSTEDRKCQNWINTLWNFKLTLSFVTKWLFNVS